MTTRFLACYISCVLLLICSLMCLVTVVPAIETQWRIAQGICGGVALGFAALGRFCGLRSPEHWINRSLLLQGALTMLALGVPWLILLGMLG